MAASDAVPQVTDLYNAEGLVSTRDQGFAAATFDGSLGTSTFQPTGGVGYYFAFRPCQNGAPAKLYTQVSVVGATLTATDNQVGVYTVAAGVLTQLAVAADFSTAWTSTGLQSTAITATLTENTLYYFGLLSVGTTIPIFVSSPAPQTAIVANVNGLTSITAGTALAFSLGSSLTTLPATAAVASGTALTKKIWIGAA